MNFFHLEAVASCSLRGPLSSFDGDQRVLFLQAANQNRWCGTSYVSARVSRDELSVSKRRAGLKPQLKGDHLKGKTLANKAAQGRSMEGIPIDSIDESHVSEVKDGIRVERTMVFE